MYVAWIGQFSVRSRIKVTEAIVKGSGLKETTLLASLLLVHIYIGIKMVMCIIFHSLLTSQLEAVLQF